MRSAMPPGIARSRSAISLLSAVRAEPFAADRLEVDDACGPRAPAPGSRVPRSRSASSHPLPRIPCSASSASSPQMLGLDVLERAGVPGVRRHLVLHVVVAQRDVAPLLGAELRAGRPARRRTRRCAAPSGSTPSISPCSTSTRCRAPPSGRSDGRSPRDERLVRHGEHREVERGIVQAARLVRRDVHAQLLEEPEDGAGLRRARRVVIAGDRARSAPRAAPRAAAGIAGRRRRSPRWWGGRSGRGRRRRRRRPGAPR